MDLGIELENGRVGFGSGTYRVEFRLGQVGSSRAGSNRFRVSSWAEFLIILYEEQNDKCIFFKCT